jgi:hypothetical protein
VPEFETTAQGSRVATSVGGVLTGRGADIIVIDDPLKPEEAHVCQSGDPRGSYNAQFEPD